MVSYYKYTNAKFWLLMSVCLLILSGSTLYHIAAIRAAERQFRATFAQTSRMVLHMTDVVFVAQQRDALRQVGERTVGKLALARYMTPEALPRWLDATFDRFLSQDPHRQALALYDPQGDRQIQRGTSDCLSDTVAVDDVCLDRQRVAIRLSVPVTTATFARAGWLSMVVIVPPTAYADIERDYGASLSVTTQHQTLYASQPMPLRSLPVNIQIAPVTMNRIQVHDWPSRLLTRRGLWYVYTVQLGRAPTTITIHAVRNGNVIIWKTVNAVLINACLFVATALLFGYFHVNYRFISHVYRSVIDGMDDFLAFKNRELQYQVINAKMARTLFGRHPKEVIGRTDAELGLPEEMREQCHDSDHYVIEQRERLHLIESGVTTDGRLIVIDVLKTPMFHASGTFGGVVICGRDIYEQTRLQAALDALEESYFSSEWILAKLLQTMPEFIYLKDRQHRFVRASQSVCEFYGLPDVIGLTDYDTHPPELASGFWEMEERLLTGQQESYTNTEKVFAVNGKTRYILTTKTILRDKRGRIAGLLGIGRDVTEMMDKQTAFEYVITQITQQTLQEVQQQKQRTDKFIIGD